MSPAGETLRQRQSPAEHAGAAANRESRDPTAVPRPLWGERLTCEQAMSLEWQEHCNGNGPSKIPDFANSGRLSQSSTATSEPGSEWERRVMLEELPRGQSIWCPVLDDPGRQPHGMQGQDESTMLDEFGPARIVDTPITEAGFTGLGVGAGTGTAVGARTGRGVGAGTGTAVGRGTGLAEG